MTEANTKFAFTFGEAGKASGKQSLHEQSSLCAESTFRH